LAVADEARVLEHVLLADDAEAYRDHGGDEDDPDDHSSGIGSHELDPKTYRFLAI
jgi:hypothetical protein